MEDYPRPQGALEVRFADEAACRAYLVALRWPDGFRCPRCGGSPAWTMGRGLWLCQGCRRQASVLAGTIFQDSRLELRTWFRAAWLVSSQKHGVSALGLQRVLGLGSYKTAWTMLHKLRRAMIRPGRERLHGAVEVDETYWGAEEAGAIGRRTATKTLILVAAEAAGERIGRIRMRRIPDRRRCTLHRFIGENVEPGSTVRTDGLPAYGRLAGYRHEPRPLKHSVASTTLPRVHQAIALLKRWLLGTHQGAIRAAHLDDYLDEFVLRFNRRTSASRGKLFYRLLQQAVQAPPQPYHRIIQPQDVRAG